jgi:hypothetical protein
MLNMTKYCSIKIVQFLNAHLTGRSFLFCFVFLKGLDPLYLAVLSNICDNMVHIHFLQTVQFNITRLSFLKIMLQMNTEYRYISNNISHY